MAKARMFVLAKAHEGCREKLEQWYDGRHIPDLLKVPGLVAARRSDVRTLKMPEGFPAYDSLAIYDLDGDIDAILRESGSRMGTAAMPTSPAMDSSKTLALVAIDRTDP